MSAIPQPVDFVIIGGGIVGLSTAMALTERFAGARVTVLEKEDRLAAHQTGRNSGVIHSGIYYKPGSFKARFARAGSRSMVAFCEQHGIAHDICGKIIVATRESELAGLETLYRRGQENELAIERIDAQRIREIEPHVRGLAAIRVPMAGIVDYTAVCTAMARQIELAGGTIVLGARVVRIDHKADGIEVVTPARTVRARYLVNCAGLHCDRVATMEGVDPGLQIVPFRGEYYMLKPEARELVRHLIYPVPDPAFPFLGVHFTRMIDGSVEAGPNAVLAFAREGYRRTDFDLHDLAEVLAFRGFRRLAARYWRPGMAEMWRSWSKAAFVRSLQALIPEVRSEHLVPAESGIRAQALRADGALVDDFHIIRGTRSVHVCNAPSPAATASLEIGRHVAGQMDPL
ncbi:MAG: L-2-hydroxyglutarate oxidase [Pseudomonadota bacterium]|nr:L-2-hydroxyglutarate oxidase [Pseudomonadota bacterium]